MLDFCQYEITTRHSLIQARVLQNTKQGQAPKEALVVTPALALLYLTKQSAR